MAVMDRMESINTCPQRLNSGRGRRSMARPSSEGKAPNFCATPEFDTKSTSGLQNSGAPPRRKLKVARFYAHWQALSSAKNSLSPQSEKFQYEKFLHEIGTLLVGYLLAGTALASTIRACGRLPGKAGLPARRRTIERQVQRRLPRVSCVWVTALCGGKAGKVAARVERAQRGKPPRRSRA